jgi:putative methylase
MNITKSRVAIVLSKLEQNCEQEVGLEQYTTPSEIAAELLWGANMKNDLANKTVGDLGCGNGVLGIGAMLLGAQKVVFVEKSETSMKICKSNVKKIKEEFENLGKCEYILGDVEKVREKVDVVVMNPPFGTKIKHADKEFLEIAFRIAGIVYSIHKFSTRKFIEKISQDKKLRITDEKRFDFPIKKSKRYHKKNIFKVDVAVWRFEKM